MEELSSESRAVYELLRHEFADDLDRKLKTQAESLLQSMSKIIDANNTTLDKLMTARADRIRDEIALDLEQLRTNLYKHEETEPDPKADSGQDSRGAGRGHG